MRSTLKKSLYLGLAALSFASVAGVANNANAAKHHKATKTYAKASYKNIPNQGNSNVAYNVTGSNALFNKPGTVKGAKTVASKATMSDLASAKENFMVYQTATTNRGSKYIKVVSFNKQYRGWIYAGNNNSASYGTGVNQVNLSTQAAPKYSTVYLSNPGVTALKSTPEGAQFNASSDNFSHTGFVAGDLFNVDAAQTVSKTGTTWYHLVDQKDNTINGWVPGNQVQLSSDNNYFDKANDVKVNFTSNGNVVKSAYVPIDASKTKPGFAGGYLDSGNVADHINNFVKDNTNGDITNADTYGTQSPLYKSGYQMTSALDGNNSALSYVKPGDTINVNVGSSSKYGPAASKLNFNVTNGANASTINTSNVYMPSFNDDQQAVLHGDNYQYMNVGNVLGNSLFTKTTNPKDYTKGLGTLYGKDQIATSDVRNNNGDLVAKQGQTFHYVYNLNSDVTQSNNLNAVYGNNLNLYYTADAVSGSANITGSNTNTNYFA